MSDIECAVDEIFGHYDSDGSGYLEKGEANKFITDLFAHMGKNIGESGRKYVLEQVDSSGDGKISKDELKDLIQAAMSQ